MAWSELRCDYRCSGQVPMFVDTEGCLLVCADISREPFVPLGVGKPRKNGTGVNYGVYDGAFDSAIANVALGHFDRGDETWLYEQGGQRSHNGILPQYWSPVAGGPVASGVQRLVMRRNGYVSLTTTSDKWGPAASFRTVPMALPRCPLSSVRFSGNSSSLPR